MPRILAGVAALLLGGPLVLRGCGEAPAQRLFGLWSRYESRSDGDPLRFYYFHDKQGIGLYRYGRVGLNFTNSYDYAVKGDRLSLSFRKTGERWDVGYRIEKDTHGEWLVLEPDPREARPVRYLRRKTGLAQALPPWIEPAGAEGPDADEDWGRMWTCQQRYATGGLGFRIYQLKDLAIDGRGIGWYHQGDYDEWSTEALRYRVAGGRLELEFVLRGERAGTAYGLGKGPDGKRRLVLEEDPRNFWHIGRFVDLGRSF
jgi:hypothetical protein